MFTKQSVTKWLTVRTAVNALMNSHTRKFISYMILAVIVYVLIYVLLVGYLRYSARDSRAFCEQIEAGMSLSELRQLATQQGLEAAVSPVNGKDNMQMLFVSQPQTSSAACQGLIVDEKLKEKKFMLSIF